MSSQGHDRSMDQSKSLTRREFDDVIRRAAELAASEPEGGDAGLTERDLFRIAAEVGLDERFVRKALADVRGSPAPATTPLSRLYGPLALTAYRVVPGTAEKLAGVIDEFMVAGQLLQSVRQSPSMLQYRPAVDWASQIARAASSTSRKYYVASAKRVEVRLQAVDELRTMVELEVEPGTRDDYLAGGIIGGLSGGAVLGAGLAMAIVATGGAAALGVAVGVASGSATLGGIVWATGHRHRRRLLEVRAEMEGILDRLEAGESLEPPPPSWRRWVRRHFHGVAKEFLGDSGRVEE